MNPKRATATGIVVATAIVAVSLIWMVNWRSVATLSSALTIHHATVRDVPPPLATMTMAQRTTNPETSTHEEENDEDADLPDNVVAPQGAAGEATPPAAQTIAIPREAVAIEQKELGTKAEPAIVARFDGLGEGFEGPQGTARFGNPSDNSLAVGLDHIVQIVNTRMAVYTKKGKRFDTTGKVLYGPVATGNVFKGFFGEGVELNNGDAVVRYDQLADRWLIVMPVFRRLPPREMEPPAPKSGEPAQRSMEGIKGQPGDPAPLHQPTSEERAEIPGRGQGGGRGALNAGGSYAMCYALSTSSDPLGSYYRYQFVRPLFPDYPRPAVWPDGYYVPTSTGDRVVQKQAFVVDRVKMLKGEDAIEQGFIIDGVNFSNNADVDGQQTPPPDAPNIMMAAGGTQLKHILDDDGIYYWKFHVDWDNPAKSKLDGPTKISVAPYHYLGGGQLTNTVPQPGIERRLDAQGDKIMQRLA